MLQFASADWASERRGQPTASVEIRPEKSDRRRTPTLAASDDCFVVVGDLQVIELLQAVWRTVRHRDGLSVQEPEHEE